MHGDDKLPQIGASDVTCALGDIDLGSDPLVELKKWVVGVLSKVVGATEVESRTEVPPVVRTVISARSNGTDATAVFEERYNSVRSQGMRTLSIRSKALSLSPATKDLAGLPVISYAPLAKICVLRILSNYSKFSKIEYVIRNFCISRTHLVPITRLIIWDRSKLKMVLKLLYHTPTNALCLKEILLLERYSRQCKDLVTATTQCETTRGGGTESTDT